MTLPPWELVEAALLKVVLPGFLGAAAVLTLVRWRANKKCAAIVGPAVAVLVGLIAGNAFRDLVPWIPEDVAWHRLLVAAVAAVVVETLARLPRVPEGGRAAIRLVGCAAIAALVVPRELWTSELWWSGTLIALGVVATWLLPVRIAQKLPGGATSLLTALVLAGGAATILIHAHSGRFTDMATLLAACLIGVAMVSRPGRLDDGSAAAVTAAFVPGLMAAGWTETFSEVPTAAFLLVAAAPAALGVTLIPPVNRWKGWRLVAATAGLIGLPVLIGVALAASRESIAVGY